MKTASLGLLEVIAVRRMPGGGIPPGPPLFIVLIQLCSNRRDSGKNMGRGFTTTDGLLIFKPYRPSAYSSLVNVEFSMPGEEGIKLLKTKRR